jgi:hypothetical protein
MEFSVALVAITAILMPLGILAIIFFYANRSESRFHQTMQKAIENGQTLNEELLASIPGYKPQRPKPGDDMRNGVITSGVGLGITLLGLVGLGSVIAGAGLLVLCIGLTIAGYAYFSQNQTTNDQQQD